MSCMEDADFALALRLQEEEDSGAVDVPVPTAGAGPPPPPPAASLVDEALELIDPTPDIYQLFRDFDKHFFWGKLGGVELKWSPRMTRCAGVCSYQPASGLCSVRLSRPLLTLRPRSDLVETLLHEMIHALLFVTRNIDNHEEHGPEFHRHMHRINKIAGTNISVYHTFHDEVRHMLTHWWRCTGACRRRPPHFGFVKRSMNRAPGRNDFWWRDHQASCGGTFEKIREPEGYGKKKGKKEIAAGVGNKLQDIRNFVVNGKAVPPAKKPAGRPPPVAGGGQPGRRGGASAGSGSRRTPTAGPAPPPLADGPAKRPAPGGAPPPPPKRPPGLGAVRAGGGPPVGSLTGNVHGFHRRGGPGGGRTATAGGSRTVTVPTPGSRGGPRQPATGAQPAGASFGGVGHVLGGAGGVPWYKRDRPPTPVTAPTPAASRTATGIFCSPETASESTTADSGVGEGRDTVEPVADAVTCPVCGEKASLQQINDHVDLCLAAGSERVESGAGSVWEGGADDELLMSQAADRLESSLEAAGWQSPRRDDGTSAMSTSGSSTAYDLLREPIVIDSSDDEEEDVVSQRANLSDVIKSFIKVEESDDELFDD